MYQLRVPPQMVGGIGSLPDIIAAECQRRAVKRDDADDIVELLPPHMKAATCFLDRLSLVWRYDFGMPLRDLEDSTGAIGTHMFQEVTDLLDVLQFVKTRLAESERLAYLARLDDESRHEDVLVECAPVLRIDRTIEIRHEQSGFGVAKTTIDWVVGPINAPILLLEVKNRQFDLIAHLNQAARGEQDGTGVAPPPHHAMAPLFHSVESKFGDQPRGSPIQVVWIRSQVKQDRSALSDEFLRLNPLKIHAVLLGDWNDDVTVLSRMREHTDTILSILGLTPSNRFTFDRM